MEDNKEQITENTSTSTESNAGLIGGLMGFFLSCLGIFGALIFANNPKEKDRFISGWLTGFLISVVLVVVVIVAFIILFTTIKKSTNSFM